MNRISKVAATILLGAVLVGCSGGKHNNTPVASKNLIGGQVTDGYIANADILVDINKTTKAKFDKGDYKTTTDAKGEFGIDSGVKVEKGTFIYANGGVNIATGEEFNGTLKGVFNGNKEKIVLSPLTTMVAAKVEKGADPETAKSEVAKALNIPEDAVEADPAKNKEALKATQKVVAAAKVLQAVSKDSKKSVSDIIEDLAKNLDGKSLDKAIEETADNKDAAQAAKETVKTVEDAIDTLDSKVDDSAAIENIVTNQVVSGAVEAAKSDGNVTEALDKAETAIKDSTTLDIAQAVACLGFDKIKGANSDENEVTKNLALSKARDCAKNGVEIKWISVEPEDSVDLATGKVQQDNYKSQDVVLEANVSKSGQFTIKPILFTVPAKGHIPVAVNDIAKTDEDKAVTIDILANDSDEDGLKELKIKILKAPANGSAEVKGDKIVYTPKANFNGKDSFVYALIDPLGAEAKATVDVVVASLNDAPTLSKIEIPKLTEDAPAGEIELKATDSDKDKLTFSATSSNEDILEVKVEGNKLKYIPKPNANGKVKITITVKDSNGATATQTIPVEIKAVNDAPVVKDDVLTVFSNKVTLIDVLKNDSDVDGDTLTIKSVTQPSSGKVEIVGGKIKYNPATDFNGKVSFNYTVTDGKVEKTATVTLNVQKYVSKMTQAIEEVENYDLEDNGLDALLDKVKNILQSAPSSEKDAKVGLAIVELADTLSAETDSLISVDGESGGALEKLLTSENRSTALADTIDDLSDQTEESLTAIATKLKAVSAQLDTLFADKSYIFKYKDTEINANDAKAISGLLLLEAADLEYLSAYNIAKKEYVETKSIKVDGKTYEYQLFHADPVTVLNDSSTLSLNSNAQSHFDKSKEYLNSALEKLTSFDKTKSKLDFKDKIAENKTKLSAIKTSLNGGADYVIKDNRDRDIYIKVAALFNEATAPTLANTLGNDWKYKPNMHMFPYVYDKELSKIENKPMGSYYDSKKKKKYKIEMEEKLKTIPMQDNNTLTKVVTKIKDDDKTYSGDELLKLLFGELDISGSKLITRYKNASDVEIVYTIKTAAGYTGPYSCKIDSGDVYKSSGDWEYIDVKSILSATIVDGNKCKIKVKDNDFAGTIMYEVVIEDSYGHHKRRYRFFAIEGSDDEASEN